MVKKLGLASLFTKNRDPSWQWPSCNQPRTSSFRDISLSFINSNYNKTISSTYIDSTDSCFTQSSTLTESESFSTESEPSDMAESVIHAVKSDRLFFEPGSTSSIVDQDQDDSSKCRSDESGLERNAIAVELQSEDPYKDFRRSMEEMVTANGVKDLDCLEEMLGWYLVVNPKNLHGIILGAFIDLLLGLACNSDCCSSSSSCSSLSFRVDCEEGKLESSCSSCEIVEVKENEA
ncbi:hypothetical protein LUZ60_001731 [Juncus effusus]|nr:hypothetical protein LUZ60_001731 [Juncus effusus]